MGSAHEPQEKLLFLKARCNLTSFYIPQSSALGFRVSLVPRFLKLRRDAAIPNVLLTDAH